MYSFFLDIDGTIFDGTRVADEVIDAMIRAREAGHKVFINTARAYVGMPEQVYGLPVDGFVNSYGLEVFADGKFIYRHSIPRERVIEIAKYAFENEIKMYFEGEIRIDINNYHEGGLNPADIVEFEQMLGKHQMSKLVLCDRPTDADKALLGEEFDFYGIEVIAKGFRKSRGIKTVEDYFGLPHENTVAIGDTDSDIDMIQYAGVGISMGNGTPKLKASAKYVTKSYKEFGVAYAIDRLLEGDVMSLEKKA